MTGAEHAALLARAERGDKYKAALESVLQGTGDDALQLRAITERADEYRAALELIADQLNNSKPDTVKLELIGAMVEVTLCEVPKL